MWLDLCYRALLDVTLLWLEKYFILWIWSTRSLFGDLCSSDMEQVVTCCKCSFSGLKSKWDELFHKILIMLCNFLQQKICFFHPWFTECWVLRCCRILLRQTTLIKKIPRFKLFPYCICFLICLLIDGVYWFQPIPWCWKERGIGWLCTCGGCTCHVFYCFIFCTRYW